MNKKQLKKERDEWLEQAIFEMEDVFIKIRKEMEMWRREFKLK